MGQESSIYVYKLTTENGGAPCVDDELWSLAICKPGIRRMAAKGDLVFGFAGDTFRSDSPVPRHALLYVARVEWKLAGHDYYAEPYGRRGDCIYEFRAGRYSRRRGARYHDRPSDLVHDLGEHPEYEKAWVLVSTDFRYFGARGSAEYKTRYRMVAEVLEARFRNYCVNHSDGVRRQLLALKDEVWRDTRKRVVGPPCSAPTCDACRPHTDTQSRRRQGRASCRSSRNG